jgi:integrase
MARKKQARRPGEGTVFQRKDGRWVCEITLEDHSRKQYYFKTEKEALEKRRTVVNELAQGVLATGPQQTLKQYLEYWLEDVYKVSVRLNTYRNCGVLVHKHLVPGLGHIKLQKLTAQQVQSFYAKKLKSGTTASRIKTIHVALHTALEHARRMKLVSLNVCSDVELPRREKREKQPLTPEQARLLLQKVREHQLEGVLTLALATGMREGELLGLRWSDVDVNKGSLRVARTVTYIPGHGFVEGEPKTVKSKRNIILPPFVIDTLKRHRVRQLEKRLTLGTAWVDRDLVFPDDDGDFLVFTTLLRRFYKLLKEIGLPRITFHDLRHSAATLLLDMGVPAKVVQELLGHSTISITMDVYSHVLPSMQKDAMDKMGDFLDSSFQ